MGVRKVGTGKTCLVGNIAAHANGLTHIAWSTNGKHVLTGGCDGKVTIAVAPSKDIEAKTVCSISDHKEAVTALAVSPSGKHFASAAEDHIVKLYSYPDGKFDSNVTRFTLPLRSLAFSATGGTLAAGGDDEGIRLISVADASISQVLKGHHGSVSSLAFDPQHTLLGSSGSDGTILVHDVEAAKVVHELNAAAPKGAPGQGLGNTVGWHPDGKLMAVPGPENEILVIDRVSGEVAFSLSDVHTEAVATLAWSPNGRYLASADRDQVVLIWDMTKREDLVRYDHVADISGLAWRPGGNDLAVADWGGKYGIWESAIPSHLPGPCGSSEEPDVSLRFSMHDSEEDGVSAKNSQGTSSGGASGEPDADGNEEEAPEKETRHAPPAKKAAKPVAKEGDAGAKETREEVGFAREAVAMQPPFQPGGTSANASRRHFLVYNMLGCVTSQQEEGHATVQVEFHDTSRAGSRLPALTDFFGFTMAALGDAGVLLAVPKRGGKSPSALMFRPLSSWAPNAEWSVRFPEGEEVLAIALGRSFVAAATSLGALRIFSLAGVQRFVASLPGPLVCLAAHESRLAVVTHAGTPLPDGSQVLEVAQWEIGLHALSGPRGVRLALSAKATLTWLGFTEEGQLATYDSQGTLRVLVEEMGGCWVPLFSSASERKSASERHWVVGVGDRDLYCILCKADGPDAQPQVTPRPVLRLLPLAVPLLPGDSTALEEEGVRLTLQRARAQAQPRREEEILALETAWDKNLVRQMAAACAGDNAVRALDLAGQLVLHKSLERARLYASTMRMGALADRLSNLVQDRMDAEAARPPPAHSTTPVPSVRPSFPATTTPLPAESREPQLPPVTPVFTPDLNHASKPSFTPAPGVNPEVTPAKPQERAATKYSSHKEAPATVPKPELKTPAGFGGAKEMKPSPFARKAAPAAKESLMSALSSAQKQQAAAAAAAAGGLKRKGLQGSLTSNAAKAPRK